MVEAKEIDVTPHVTLMPKLGAGYRVAEAVNELIENSVDAKVANEKLVVFVEIKNEFIRVVDNASGMSKDDLIKGMRIAYSEKKNKLGSFGIGMKGACTSLGFKFTISTKIRGEATKYVVVYDENEWIRNDSWKKQILRAEKAPAGDHGTEIVIEKLKVPIYPQLITRLKEVLSKRFGAFIKSGELQLKVNKEYVKYEQPNLVKLPYEKSEKITIEIDLGDEKKITGWYGFLATRHTKGYYGFHLFKTEDSLKNFKKLAFLFILKIPE